VINFPDTLVDTLIVTLYWAGVADAASYRIYRSPAPARPPAPSG